MSPQPLVTIDDARRAVLDALVDVAPDLEGTDIPPEAELQADLGLDSMDFVNLLAALSEQLEVDIPERDYSLLDTVEACAAYLRDRAEAR
jgi:acyl carrier protein